MSENTWSKEESTPESPQPFQLWHGVIVWSMLGFLTLFFFLQNHETPGEQAPSSQIQKPSATFSMMARYILGAGSFQALAGGGATPSSAIFVRQIKDAATNPLDQLCAATVIAEIAGGEQALDYLVGLDLPAEALELETVRGGLSQLYQLGTPNGLDDPQRAILAERLGWFGEVALVFGQENDSDPRSTLLAQAQRTFFATLGFSVVAVGAFCIGLVLFVAAFVLFKRNRLSFFYPSATGNAAGSRLIFLETMVVFLALMAFIPYLTSAIPNVPGWFHYPFVFLAPFWPRIRGLSWSECRQGLGLHLGKGLFRETLFGILGYLAGLPILAACFVITFMLVSLTGADAAHPIVDQLGAGGPSAIIGLFVLAAVAAPIIEEIIFRGAFFHYLRRFLNPVFAGILSGLIFAAIHPQGFAAIPVLGAVGFNLAMIREWRDSVFPSIIAHALNNGSIVCLLIMMT